MNRSRSNTITYQFNRSASFTSCDPFAINPIRRSLATFVLCGLTLFVALAWLESDAQAVAMMLVGWPAIIGLVFSFPVLLICLGQELWGRVSRKIRPSIELLDLSPRAQNLLRRYGFEAIAQVDQVSDEALLMLTNFDALALREVRRAINLWKYQRWQEAGFPPRGF